MTARNAEEENEIIISAFSQEGSIRQAVAKTGYSWNKIVKTLSTAGIVCNDRHRKILELYSAGKPVEEIAGRLGISVRTVACYLPRIRPVPGYCETVNAQRIRKCRGRKNQDNMSVSTVNSRTEA